MRTQATLEKVGDCLVLRLPESLKKLPGFSVGDTFNIEVTSKGLNAVKASGQHSRGRQMFIDQRHGYLEDMPDY
ncbi:hypothetical protein EAMG_03513 [Escherichia coli M056]|uniref:hypothetical protein n=1 Tax=Escherichia coli TaxID=562 RepID=UPI000A189A80|nr:hypothetical protein [Escherichia coli]OSK32968.1 hypothetical protein EAMG_03513 [Escherichia coli M056]